MSKFLKIISLFLAAILCLCACAQAPQESASSEEASVSSSVSSETVSVDAVPGFTIEEAEELNTYAELLAIYSGVTVSHRDYLTGQEAEDYYSLNADGQVTYTQFWPSEPEYYAFGSDDIYLSISEGEVACTLYPETNGMPIAQSSAFVQMGDFASENSAFYYNAEGNVQIDMRVLVDENYLQALTDQWGASIGDTMHIAVALHPETKHVISVTFTLEYQAGGSEVISDSYFHYDTQPTPIPQLEPYLNGKMVTITFKLPSGSEKDIKVPQSLPFLVEVDGFASFLFADGTKFINDGTKGFFYDTMLRIS